jgi:transposase
VLRAKIVLLAGAGVNNNEIADRLGISIKTARKWRGRFGDDRLEGLLDAERSGRPAQFGSTVRHDLFSLVVSPPPPPFARWTVDLLAEHLVESGIVQKISRDTVSLWLRSADIKPHRCRYWLTSKDPDFQAKRDRVINIYLNPPMDGEVLCVDEKTSIQALEHKYPEKPVRPGRRRAREFEYIRHGTAHLLAAFNVATGSVITEVLVGKKNDSAAFIKFLRRLLKAYPKGRKLYLVLDNGTTHRSKETKNFLDSQPRLVPVFLPTHASWLNQVEIWFSVLSRQALKNVSFASREALRDRILDYVALHNKKLAHPYKWTSKGKPLTGGKKKSGGAVKAFLGRTKRRAVI